MQALAPIVEDGRIDREDARGADRIRRIERAMRDIDELMGAAAAVKHQLGQLLDDSRAGGTSRARTRSPAPERQGVVSPAPDERHAHRRGGRRARTNGIRSRGQFPVARTVAETTAEGARVESRVYVVNRPVAGVGASLTFTTVGGGGALVGRWEEKHR
jgi:hypothetical protein